jgi:ARG and Rhodanese-Phosphatase-superfamily-associated Protein domain
MTSLTDTVQLGEAVEHRGIVVAPLFPRLEPRAEYVTLEEALPLGFAITEVDGSGSVPELLATNPLDADVLLYDGEELLGAKQNRILNVTVLVAARSQTRIPVSCVEEGRWHASSLAFDAAPHATNPELRRLKAEWLSAAPLERGRAQSAVWAAVAETARVHRVESPTLAHADVFHARGDELGALRRAFPLQPGQSGALLALGPGQACLDWVSRPDAFAGLYPKLLEGYLLDAVSGEQVTKCCKRPGLEGFLAAAAAGARSRRPSSGLGEDVRLRGEDVVGSGLELHGELIQLSAFSSAGDADRTRVARPSRRR